MLKINNVKIGLNEKDYIKKISQLLNLPKNKIKNVKLVKQAVDARRKNNIHFICSFHFEVENESLIIKNHPKLSLTVVKENEYLPMQPNHRKIVVVGSGPAGLFCAYQLARSGQIVTLLERGQNIEQRIQDVDDFFAGGKLNPQSNIQFGEGGAGTFSDGKLTTGVKDSRIQFILETLVKHGANEDILYRSKPHVGTDVLVSVVTSMRQYIIEQGGTVLFNHQMVGIETKNHKVCSIQVKNQKNTFTMEVDQLVLAIGHSARDTYEMLYQSGVEMVQKPFAVGLRIEHAQSFINESQYGKMASHPSLPVADYKLAVHCEGGRGVYSFCMCPGGTVVNASSEEGRLVVNGMSNYAREKDNANSAILVTVNTDDFGSDDVLAGMKFQRQLETDAFILGGSNYHVPIQRVEDYLQDCIELTIDDVIPSVSPNYKICALSTLFSNEINAALKEGLLLMDKKIPGFASNAILSGVESRSSAPVRIVRNQNYQANIVGIYPIGEGAGYAGGIMSSAIDGLKCAQALLEV